MEREDRWEEHPIDLEEQLVELLNKNVHSIEGGSGEMDEDTEERLRELGYIE
jgi:hypothetical protein